MFQAIYQTEKSAAWYTTKRSRLISSGEQEFPACNNRPVILRSCQCSLAALVCTQVLGCDEIRTHMIFVWFIIRRSLSDVGTINVGPLRTSHSMHTILSWTIEPETGSIR